MFTGIIESLGTIRSLDRNDDGITLWIDLAGLDTSTTRVGDSIAVNGTCLTVTRQEGNEARFDVSGETLSKCLIGQWQETDRVNLERAMTLATPLGGHLVSGHVDGIGTLVQRRDDADSSWMQISTNRDIGRFIAIKGSLAVDGISLTSNKVYDEGEVTYIELTLVPHTLAMTTLSNLESGNKVHIEIDLIARYLDRMSQSDADSASHKLAAD